MDFRQLISNKNYSSILYLLIKKDYTYFGEIRRLLNTTTNFHLGKLQEYNLVESRKATDIEKEDIKILFPRFTNDILHNKEFIYVLTPKAHNRLKEPQIFELLQIFSKKSLIDEHVITQRELCNTIKEERHILQLRQKEHDERIYKMKMKFMNPQEYEEKQILKLLEIEDGR